MLEVAKKSKILTGLAAVKKSLAYDEEMKDPCPPGF